MKVQKLKICKDSREEKEQGEGACLVEYEDNYNTIFFF